jgi:hypothetical protein
MAIFNDAPFTPLGLSYPVGKGLPMCCYRDAIGKTVNLAAAEHNKANILLLAGGSIKWLLAQFPCRGQPDKFDQAEVARAMIEACCEAGPHP